MKHCHFSILWNELPFLKQKLPFLYKHFDQLIFFDLYVKKPHPFSTDGGHEYIKNFPDPDNKITLIEDRDLFSVKRFFGAGCKEKQRMFAIGSEYVKDDIDVFWCTDMDEFFTKTLMLNIEHAFESNPKRNSIKVPHVIFFKNEKYVISRENSSDFASLVNLPWPRIYRHSPGKIYPHCGGGPAGSGTIKDQLDASGGEIIFHFGDVGRERMLIKKSYRGGSMGWFDKFNNAPFVIAPGEVKFLKQIRKDSGLALNTWKIPDYINIKQLMHDLGAPQ